jgi:hypothetical protein
MKKLVLICIIIIISVVAIALGTKIYKNKVVEENRQAVINDLNKISEIAMEFYGAPLQIGGGDNNWAPVVDGEYQQNRCALWLNFTGVIRGECNDEFTTENGTYKLWLSSYEDKTLKMLGTGTEIGKDGEKPVMVRLDLNGPTKGVSLKIMN